VSGTAFITRVKCWAVGVSQAAAGEFFEDVVSWPRTSGTFESLALDLYLGKCFRRDNTPSLIVKWRGLAKYFISETVCKVHHL